MFRMSLSCVMMSCSIFSNLSSFKFKYNRITNRLGESRIRNRLTIHDDTLGDNPIVSHGRTIIIDIRESVFLLQTFGFRRVVSGHHSTFCVRCESGVQDSSIFIVGISVKVI